MRGIFGSLAAMQASLGGMPWATLAGLLWLGPPAGAGGPPRFLDDAAASHAFEAYLASGGEYTFAARRSVTMDILRWGGLFLRFEFAEGDRFDPSPRQIDHELEYGAIGYDFGGYRLKLFADHRCDNPARGGDRPSSAIHYNELGLRVESKGSLPGHRNHGIDFRDGPSFLNRLNYSLSAGRIFPTEDNDYDASMKAVLRNDVFWVGRHVLYIEGRVDAFVDDRGPTARGSVEVGDRFRLAERVCLLAYLRYEYDPDAFGVGREGDFLKAGVAVETRFGRKEADVPRTAPAIDVAGSYLNFHGGDAYGHESDVELRVGLPLAESAEAFVRTRVEGLTRQAELVPTSMTYGVGPGVGLRIGRSVLGFTYTYLSSYAADREASSRAVHSLRIGLRSPPSPPDWSGTATLYLGGRGFDYDGEIGGSVRWDILDGVTPYVGAEASVLFGTALTVARAVEGGVLLPGRVGSCRLFARYQKNQDPFVYGAEQEHVLTGVRFAF